MAEAKASTTESQASKASKSLEDLDLWLIVGTPRGRLRYALSRTLRDWEAQKPLSVVSLENYIRPEKELPRLEGGAWNLSHEDAIHWDKVIEDLKDMSDTGEVVVICDDRASGCRTLLDACKRIIVCSSTELGCFKDCILSRVTLEDYSRRLWPTYQRRALRFWAQLAEGKLRSKASVLDEDAFRDAGREAQDAFATQHLTQLLATRLEAKAKVKMLETKDIGKWTGRICDAPERNQRKFQQVRKDVLYAFEMEARSFATSMTRQLVSGSMADAEAALKALEKYRLSLHSMSQEERAKWSSVICTREVGPRGEVLSVEILRWASERLRELRDADASCSPSQGNRVTAVLQLETTDAETIPFAQLLGPDAEALGSICAAVEHVIQFGRLFFLRQRMWDACPETTLQLAQLLLEHPHWLLQCLGSRFCAQLLDADPARYQVCFRDLARTRGSGSPFSVVLTRALLNIASPVLTELSSESSSVSSVSKSSEGDEVQALWRGEWYRAHFLKHDAERSEIQVEWKTQVDSSERREWRPEGWVRSTAKEARGGYDYWRWLRERHLVDASALRKLLNRAPEHCLHLIQVPGLVASLHLLLHRGVHCGLLHLAAEAAGSLARLLRYGPSQMAPTASAGNEMRDVHSLILGLSDLGSKECLGEATNYLTTLTWSLQWRQDAVPRPLPAPELPPPSAVETTDPSRPTRPEDPAVRVLELLDLEKQLQQEQKLRERVQQQLQRCEDELQSSKDTISKLLDEKKALSQRLLDLEVELERPTAAERLPGAGAGAKCSVDSDATAEENDWILKADPETLTLEDAEGFISRIAQRRDSVRVLRSSLCGGLRQLGENLYTSPVHFIEELLQNADDCSYGSLEPSFNIDATESSCHFSYNELGFRPKDVLSLCSLAVSTKTRGSDFLGHKGVGFKSVFACSNSPSIVSGKFRFKFEVPGIDELSYITPRWLDDVNGTAMDGTHISLPFRPELSGNQEFLEKLRSAVDPLVLLGLRRLRHLNFHLNGEPQVIASLTKSPVEDFLDICSWKACLRINETEHFFRIFSNDASTGSDTVLLAFPAAPGPELPVCAGLPCARVGHRFLLQANWQLTTSREAVRENVENYQLRSEAARLFCIAARHPEILPHLATFLPVTGPATPPFWQSFTEEVLHELRRVLPDYLGAQPDAQLRLPQPRIMALAPPEVFLAAGLEVVRDEAAQVVLQKCGIPGLGISDLFKAFPHLPEELKTESWWAELFQLLLENAGKPETEEVAKRQPIWWIRGLSGRRSLPEDLDIAFCSVPLTWSKSWRSSLAFLDSQSSAELRFALLTVAKPWDAKVMAQRVLHQHLELRRGELQVDQELRNLLWRDLQFLQRDLGELTSLELPAPPGDIALVPTGSGATTACLAMVPSILGCNLPSSHLDEAGPCVSFPYAEDDMMAVPEAIAWEQFLLKLGCRAPVLDDRSCLLEAPNILPPLADLMECSEEMKSILEALPARSLQWLQSENFRMSAVSGQIVPLTALVADTVVRNLPCVPEGLEVVHVPTKMEDVAATLGICVRPDVDLCWLILRSLCDAQVQRVGPYIEQLAMLQSLRCRTPGASDHDGNTAILFLPSANVENGEPQFASLSQIYVQDTPRDSEEAQSIELGFQHLRRLLHRAVISCTQNVAYWSFHGELKLLGCAAQPSVADCLQALRLAAEEPRHRQRIGCSSVKDRGELLNDAGLEVMLSLYRLLELSLSALDDAPSCRWTWKERLTATSHSARSALAAATVVHGELPIITWEGRVVTGGCSEVWACRSSWFLETLLDSTPICFVHRDVAEHCPQLVAASGWLYLEGRTTVVWQQSNNNPEKELSEVSEAFSAALQRPMQVVSCNWIALELFFSPKVEPKEGEWFADVPGVVKERLRSQPSFAMVGEGVLVLATHFVKEASERAALAAAALALALQHAGATREEAEVTARETCEKIRSFSSERFWEAGSGEQSHAGYSIRQVRSTEVLLPSGIGEEANLPGLMGSFGAVEQYDDEEAASTARALLPISDLRRDHELFGAAVGRILSERGPGATFRHTAAPSNATEILAVKEQQKRVGERAEHFYSCFLESVYGDAYKPTRDWVSSARSCVYPGRPSDDACGFDFVVLDTAQRIVPSQGKRSVRCFIEVKGCAGSFNGMFCLSANEQRKRDQIAASKSDGNAYVVAVVDNMDALEFASIRHFLWSDDVTMLRLEPDSFLAHVEPSAGRPVAGGALAAAKPPAAAKKAPAAAVATVSVPANTVGLVIGKGGATVKWMSQESGAQIHRVDGTADTGLASLKIEGTKEQIQYAKQLIQEVVYSRQSGDNRQSWDGRQSWDSRQSWDWDSHERRVWRGGGNGSGWPAASSSSSGWQ